MPQGSVQIAAFNSHIYFKETERTKAVCYM